MKFITGLRWNSHIVDRLIGLVLFTAGLYAYTSTLAPTILDGDSALYQYTPYVLGVTYPTGFPIYLLLGKLWLTLWPIGEIAWRMNLLSAVCASLSLPILYGVSRRIWANRLAGLVSVVIYATVPTFWLWATQAKHYTMSILFFSLVLLFGVRSMEATEKRCEGKSDIENWTSKIGPGLGLFLMGVQVGVHNTAVLLVPGVVWLYWRYLERVRGSIIKRIFLSVGLFLIPVTTYVYVPLRGEWLISQYGWDVAVARGLLADFYQSGLSAWIRYFTAADFTGGVVANWGRVPGDFVSVYVPFLREDFTSLGIVAGVAGMITMAWHRRAYLGPCLLMYLMPIPFVLTYGQGEQRAFLLTSYLLFAIFCGGVIVLTSQVTKKLRIPNRKLAVDYSQLLTAILAALLIIVWILPQTRHNLNWLGNKWDTATYDYWQDVLSHPLEPNAGIIATWGDLTSLWAMQHTESRRTDILGLYPPEETRAAVWLVNGRALYVAGPTISDWPIEALENYHIVPWGRLVRLAPTSDEAIMLLPALAQPQARVFADRISLSGAEFAPVVRSGETLQTFFTWQTRADIPGDVRYSLRLVQGDGIIAQKDDTLLSGWFPRDYLPSGQPLLGSYPLDIPLGIVPGQYQLQLAIYEGTDSEWVLDNGDRVLDLGEITVEFSPAKTAPGQPRFNDEIALDQSRVSVSRVKQGKGFALQVLWQAVQPPKDNYVLLVELVDQQDRVWRDWHVATATSTWQQGQQVRQQIDITIPAEAPTGDTALDLRLSWLKADGSRLPAYRWILPNGHSTKIKGPRILPKSDRIWERPQVPQDIEAVFEDKAALIGFDMPNALTLSDEASTTLPITLYWQGRGDMRDVYFTFVHVVNQDGRIVAQSDGVQAQGAEPTTSWANHEYIIDPMEIGLPADTADGIYEVIAGLYLPSNGTRLMVTRDDGTVSDSILLGEITLKREE